MAIERKDRMSLISRYSKLHKEKYKEKPMLNLNVEQWAADALIESYTLPFCYDLLDYYFETAQVNSWKYFANNAGRIVDARIDYKRDLDERAERRRAAKKWLSEG